MRAHLITVGDEILLGQIVNTNAAWLGERLAAVGADLRASTVVGDDVGDIQRALRHAFADGARVVVVTGGLGPTADDLTRDAVADAFGRELVFHDDVLAGIQARYTARGRAMPAIGRRMAEVPSGFEVLPNPKGTAPGLWGEDDHGRAVALLPGVPYEMQAITAASVLPRLTGLQDGVVISRTLVTVGKGESDLAERLGDLPGDFAPGVGLAYLPSLGTVRLRITARGASAQAVQAGVDAAIRQIRERLGRLVVGEGAELTIEAAVLGGLAERGLTIALAESCTGGAIAARLVACPGASRAVQGGVVAYSNRAKTDLLGVDPELLAAHGAVSEPVARAMARAARDRLGADIGLASTGIAGPSGGTPEKPVGTVWLGYAGPDGDHAVGLTLTTDRAVNIGLTATLALDLVRTRALDAGPHPGAEAL